MPSHIPHKKRESFTSNLVAKYTEVPTTIKKEDISTYAEMKGKLVKHDGRFAYFRGFRGAPVQKDGKVDGSRYEGVFLLECLSDEESAVLDTSSAVSLLKTKAPTSEAISEAPSDQETQTEEMRAPRRRRGY